MGILTTPGGHGYLNPNDLFDLVTSRKDSQTIAMQNDIAVSNAKAELRTDISNVLGAETSIALRRRTMPNGADANNYKGASYAGDWEVNSGATLATITNLPPGAGIGVLNVSASTGFQLYRSYKGGASPDLWFRGVNDVGTGAWSAWQKVAYDTGGVTPVKQDDPAILATRHPVRREEARARRSGVIGTGGRAAIALRFDDWHDSFRDKAAPILRKYDMPCYMATTVRHVEEISMVGWPTMQTLAVDDGFEVFGHSYSHSAATGVTAFRKEIIESADYMETNMPAVKIDGWVQPGTGEGVNAYDGFGTGESLSDYTDHPAGQLLRSRYGVVYGGRYGYLAPLVGDYKTGQLHITWEGYTLAQFQAKVKEAQDAGAGLSMMMHPNVIDNGGTMTAALFEQCIAWLAAERDAGRLVILTGSGLAFADARTPNRRNLLKSGLSSWTGSYWVETANGVEWWKTITGTSLTQAISVQAHSDMRGGQVELVYNVEAPAGAVVRTKATATGLNATKDHTLAAGFKGAVRKCFTIPANLGYDGTVTLEIGRVSGGEVRISNPRLRAI